MADLWGVIVGGALATGGGGATQWFLFSAKEKSGQKRLKAEKFEQLLTAVFSQKHWLEQSQRKWVIGMDMALPEAPIVRALALATAYLPELENEVSTLEAASMKFENWMLEAGQKRQPGKTDHIDGAGDAVKEYLRAVATFMESAREFQMKELRK